MAQRSGRDPLVAVLHQLSNLSCSGEIGVTWTDVVALSITGTGDVEAAEVGVIVRALPLRFVPVVKRGTLTHVVEQLGSDHGFHQHVSQVVQVPTPTLWTWPSSSYNRAWL